MNVKALVRMWCPPILWSWARQIRGRSSIVFEGDYASWAEAKGPSTGYDSSSIFERVRRSALRVKQGGAVFERDSVCFYREEYRWPSLSCLLTIASERFGHLHVLDLGGSLGSYYYQHKKFISMVENVRWSVVEQRHFVACGRADFQDERLRFFETVEDCLSQGSVDVAFLSGVLQFLEFPYVMLATLSDAKIPYLLIDRTGFIEGPNDRITVQRVHNFNDSYPSWFFSRQKFMQTTHDAGYRPIVEFQDDVDRGIDNLQGIFLRRI